MDQGINHVWFLSIIISCDFPCTPAWHLDARILQCSGSICPVFRRLSIALLSFASRHCAVSPWLAIIHGIVHYCLASFPGTCRLSFAIFFATSVCLACVSIIFVLFASVQPHLKNIRSNSAIVCWQQTEMRFLFLNIPSRKDSSAPPLGLPRGSPPLPHSLYGWTDVRTYGDIITKFSQLDGLPIFSYPWCFAGALHARKLRYQYYYHKLIDVWLAVRENANGRRSPRDI